MNSGGDRYLRHSLSAAVNLACTMEELTEARDENAVWMQRIHAEFDELSVLSREIKSTVEQVHLHTHRKIPSTNTSHKFNQMPALGTSNTLAPLDRPRVSETLAAVAAASLAQACSQTAMETAISARFAPQQTATSHVHQVDSIHSTHNTQMSPPPHPLLTHSVSVKEPGVPGPTVDGTASPDSLLRDADEEPSHPKFHLQVSSQTIIRPGQSKWEPSSPTPGSPSSADESPPMCGDAAPFQSPLLALAAQDEHLASPAHNSLDTLASSGSESFLQPYWAQRLPSPSMGGVQGGQDTHGATSPSSAHHEARPTPLSGMARARAVSPASPPMAPYGTPAGGVDFSTARADAPSPGQLQEHGTSALQALMQLRASQPRPLSTRAPGGSQPAGAGLLPAAAGRGGHPSAAWPATSAGVHMDAGSPAQQQVRRPLSAPHSPAASPSASVSMARGATIMSPSQLQALAPSSLELFNSDSESVRSEPPVVSGGMGMFAAITLANKHSALAAATSGGTQTGSAAHAQDTPASRTPHSAATASSPSTGHPQASSPSRVPSTAVFDGTPLHSAAASVAGDSSTAGKNGDTPSEAAQPLVEGWLLLAQATTTAAAAGDADALSPEALAQASEMDASYRLALCPGTCARLHRVWAALFRGPVAVPGAPSRQGDFMVLWRTQAQAHADVQVNKEHAVVAEREETPEHFALAFPSAVDVRPLAECLRMLPGLADSDLHIRANPQEGEHADSAEFLPDAFTAEGQAQVELWGPHSLLIQPHLCWRMAFRVPASVGYGEGLGEADAPSLGQLPETVAAISCTNTADWLAWVGSLSALTGTDISSWGD